MRFYLGTHETSWLGRLDVPLFVSHRRLRGRKSLPQARAPWALDSGGFTELSMRGRWETSLAEYVEAVDRYAREIGRLEWAAPQDWMCEPWIVAKTGLSVREHQERTVQNYLELRAAGLQTRVVPVLQGMSLDDYVACVELYQEAGVDLAAEETVGVGSVCRRQATREVGAIVGLLAGTFGLRLHGFGVKKQGVADYGSMLASSDSMAWSFGARRDDPLPGCSHGSCANCWRYALRWRAELLGAPAAAGVQLGMC